MLPLNGDGSASDACRFAKKKAPDPKDLALVVDAARLIPVDNNSRWLREKHHLVRRVPLAHIACCQPRCENGQDQKSRSRCRLERVVKLCKVGLGMRTRGAHLGSVVTLHKTAAVQATPYRRLGAHEHAPFLDILGKRKKTLFMVGLGNGDLAHDGSNLRKTFFVSRSRKFRIHDGVLVVFATGGCDKVGLAVSDDPGRIRRRDFHISTFKELEQALGVFFSCKAVSTKISCTSTKPSFLARPAK
jgi:hypothetical protein